MSGNVVLPLQSRTYAMFKLKLTFDKIISVFGETPSHKHGKRIARFLKCTQIRGNGL